MNNREQDIKDYIVKKRIVTNDELSDNFDISVQTVRKYLTKLEKKGSIVRNHGGAKAGSTFTDRLIIDVDSKRKIAKACASLLNNDDTIFIDSSSTYYFIVDYLPSNINLNIVTASVPLALRLKDLTENKIFLIGGYISDTTYGTYFTDSFSSISNIIFDKSFFGVTGFSFDFEFTEDNEESLNFQNKIRKNSKKIIIGASSKKENCIGNKKSFKFSDVDTFITEKDISEDMKNELEKNLNLILL